MEQSVFEFATQYIWGPLAAYFWWDVKKYKEKVDGQTVDIAKLEVKAVDEDKVRSVVKEEIAPLKDAIDKGAENDGKIFQGITEIKVAIAKQQGRIDGQPTN